MHLEIISPEAVLFESEIDSVVLPGANGAFEILAHHAPIASALKEGTIRIKTHTKSHLVFDSLHADVVPHFDDEKVLMVKVSSGTVEMCGDRVLVLID